MDQTPSPAPTIINLDRDDLVMVRAALAVMIEALSASAKKSRERSLVITKLQEASMWAGEGLTTEPV